MYMHTFVCLRFPSVCTDQSYTVLNPALGLHYLDPDPDLHSLYPFTENVHEFKPRAAGLSLALSLK